MVMATYIMGYYWGLARYPDFRHVVRTYETMVLGYSGYSWLPVPTGRGNRHEARSPPMLAHSGTTLQQEIQVQPPRPQAIPGRSRLDLDRGHCRHLHRRVICHSSHNLWPRADRQDLQADQGPGRGVGQEDYHFCYLPDCQCFWHVQVTNNGKFSYTVWTQVTTCQEILKICLCLPLRGRWNISWKRSVSWTSLSQIGE